MVLPRRTEMLLLLLIALFPRIARAQPPVIKLALMLPFALWNDSGSSMLERAWRGAQMAAEEINVGSVENSFCGTATHAVDINSYFAFFV